MKGSFSLYEIRIFLHIVGLANRMFRGGYVSSSLGKAVCVDGRNCNLSISIKDLLTDKCHNYGEIKKAIQNLQKKLFELYEPDKRKWHSAALLADVEIAEGDGLIKFVVPKWLLEYILSYIDTNYSRYDLAAALTLPTPYAVRLYWLTCHMKHEISYNIDALREMLGVGEKYPATKDFIKRCVEPARNILEKRNMNGFKYIRGFKKNKCTYITFFPVQREEETHEQLTARAGISAWCDPLLKQYLVFNCGFTAEGLNRNKATLFEFCKLGDWQDRFHRIVEHARRQRAGKGYYIQAMKSEVAKAADNAEK